MANSAQARKRVRQANKHRELNKAQRSALRTEMKKVIKAAQIGDKEQAGNALRAATPIIDRAAGKGLIHKNTAARYKSRLNDRVRVL